jgi:hypothetical protein
MFVPSKSWVASFGSIKFCQNWPLHLAIKSTDVVANFTHFCPNLPLFLATKSTALAEKRAELEA